MKLGDVTPDNQQWEIMPPRYKKAYFKMIKAKKIAEMRKKGLIKVGKKDTMIPVNRKKIEDAEKNKPKVVENAPKIVELDEIIEKPKKTKPKKKATTKKKAKYFRNW